MVTNALVIDNVNEYVTTHQSKINWISLPIQEVIDAELRLEASLYSTDVEQTKLKVLSNKYGFVKLSELIVKCSYPGRFKRTYVSKSVGQPFFLPSQLNEIYPKPTKFISISKLKNSKDLIIDDKSLLVTRSGTVGNCTIANSYFIGGLFSDDIIRIKTKESYDLSYIYIYLKSACGMKVLRALNYGAVIKHIEPEHLLNMPIPKAPILLRKKIHIDVQESFDLREKSNKLLDKAYQILKDELQLPKVEDFLSEEAPSVHCFSISSRELSGRLEANYHHPIVQKIIGHLDKYAISIKRLNDSSLTKSINLPGRYKRHYVEPKYGVPFIGGKEILELDPRGEKYLSLKLHSERITNELTLKNNMILVTRSGTIGKVVLVPKHWDNWTASEHLLRVIPVNDKHAGYLYAWLSSEWALPLIRRYTYGAVVFEIDQYHLGDVPIPIINEESMSLINDLVLEANELRTKAFILEQNALDVFNNQVIND